MKTALLVMAHGSPRPEANEDMRRVVDLVKQRGEYDVAVLGFLECNEPSIPDAIDSSAALGVDRLIAVPYFLHTGAHVTEDLPALLEAARMRHPHIAFSMGRYLGESPRVAEVLHERITARAVAES